ncbi:MAG: hypothetical protein ACR2P2_21230 [Nakamurella sp.]
MTGRHGCPVEYPGAISQSRRLLGYQDLMREAISFVAEVDPADVEIDLQVKLPDAIAERVRPARDLIGQLDRMQRRVAPESRDVARDLVKREHLTGADAAVVLGVSQQRVSQMGNG